MCTNDEILSALVECGDGLEPELDFDSDRFAGHLVPVIARAGTEHQLVDDVGVVGALPERFVRLVSARRFVLAREQFGQKRQHQSPSGALHSSSQRVNNHFAEIP